MAIFNGTNLGVYIGGTLVAAATDCSLSLNMETIDITTKDSAGYRELLGGLRSGSISCSGLIDYQDASNKDITDLYDAWEGRTELTLKFSSEIAGDESYTASGFLTSLEQSGGTEDTATYSATFELTGEVTEATIPA
jgi:TP901-1 family phage major tail protein